MDVYTFLHDAAFVAGDRYHQDEPHGHRGKLINLLHNPRQPTSERRHRSHRRAHRHRCDPQSEL